MVNTHAHYTSTLGGETERKRVCVCVYVCVRERQKENSPRRFKSTHVPSFLGVGNL